MWGTPLQTNNEHLSRDRPCPRCGHAVHIYLACSDICDCVPPLPLGRQVEEYAGYAAA